MLKSKRLRKWVSLCLIFILTLTLTAPAFATGSASNQKVDLKTNAPQLAAKKIAPKLAKQFDDEDYVTYLIKMKEQADVNSVSKNAHKASEKKKETPAAAKRSMRNAVVNSLRETASRTQYGLEKYLENMQKKGEVKSFESFFIVNAMAVTSTKDVMEKIALRAEVEKILPNEERFLDKAEISPEAVKEDVQPNNTEWNINQVNAPGAWEMGIDGTGIVVANLDSGVDLNHPALKRKWRGYDASGNVANPELSWYDPHSGASMPADTDGHGTHTMGTMVGSEANGSNQIGVAPGAKWIAVRIFNPSTTDNIILRGAQWLIAPVDKDGNLHPEMAPDVVNNSWGGGPGLDEWFRPMVQAWRAAQIFPEFSAGNVRTGNPGGPGSVANPANYPESFATGATDINNKVASFSLRGPSPYGEIKPEVSAPGVNVRSSVPGGGYEGGWNGTSMAGPHTTALAALLLQVNSSLTVDQLEEIIQSTATPLTDAEYPTSPNNGYGSGLINAADAVGSILSGLGSVSGRVATAGDDFEKPVIEHTPITEAYTGFDIPISARVSDNVGVVTVEAFARVKGSSHWTFIPMEQKSGDYKNGVYEGNIPYFLVDTRGTEYYIRVNDYGNNGFETTKYTIEVSNGVKPGYMQDFETNINGFTTGGTNNSWEWGVPVGGPGSAASGEKLIATKLNGPYPNSSNSYMMMPPIDLLDSNEGALLSFKHWFNLETNYDRGVVYAAAESTDFQFVPLAQFTGASNGWKNQLVDLTQFAGEQVYVIFNLHSDGSVTRDGWYIDDVSILGADDVAPAAPADLAARADSLGIVALNWTAPADADLKEFLVYRSSVSGEGYEQIGTTTENSFSDSNTANGETYYYVVTAKDYFGNESGRSNEVSVTVTAPVTIYSDNFDGETDNGWIHSGTKDEWERGTPSGTGAPVPLSAPNVWGTDLDSTYETNSNFSLVSPVIDLSQVTNATLAFAHWYELETNYDKGFVEISKDGGATWTQLGLFSHSTNGKNWSTVSYDLASYAGEQVQVRFRVTSDGSVVKLGWYIDNFAVLATPAPQKLDKAVERDVQEMVKPKAVYTEPAVKLSRTEKDKMPKQTHGGVELQSLPANATVTVLETGRSTRTNPSNGQFNMIHVAGDYTLRAEAYGFYPQTRSITVVDGQDTPANFTLEPIPHGTITGVVTDERSHAPIAGATVMVLEDAKITPVITDENGAFSLEVLEGTYTLAVSADQYYNKNSTVTVKGNGSVEANVALKPFIGFEGTIGYDDGTAENARAWNAAGNAWAVKMTPENGAAQVTGAMFRFWDTEWPVPGGTAFQYAIYDATGAGGTPGRLLAGPLNGTAKRDGTWTSVSFQEPVMVEGDFYVVYIQTFANPNTPGLATDENGKNALRSWQRISGAWSQSPAAEGNYMIRAVVQYPVTAPVITSPADGSFTKDEKVTVTGTSQANGATVKLYNGTEEAGTGTVENGKFNIETTLNTGANPLSVEAVVNGKITDRSETVNVTLDQTAPVLNVTAPVQDHKTNIEMVTVKGTTSDENLDTLTVNGQSATVNADGSFSHKVLVDSGANTITVVSTDRAGNKTTVVRNVVVDLNAPEITNISPAADVRIKPGEDVRVSFDSEEGLTASFRIELPLMVSGSNNEIRMTETSPGHYEGTYKTPSTLKMDGGMIVIKASDQAGNKVEATAPGKLYVGEAPAENKAPTAVILGDAAAKQKKLTTFDGSQSSDPDGKIVKYEWNFGDGTTGSGAKVEHTFNKKGTYTVTLTVTDDKGATNSTTHTIKIN
ncbi:PKD domain-containing protein [Neobacillus notoginsengisoli]|uniref:PKD domain-containing protein n=1 Tax=Neobacillus notoginsengisoli TaxID=1578198 RepID=A0A417Z068_9BACI|nr:S8 family serine peptidase [Neobacillus notoginsengisoli]RHW43527.1 PKD domain-containing protein [Neobacillus notoginsengisoli]